MKNFWEQHIDCCGNFSLPVEDEKRISAFEYLVQKGIIAELMDKICSDQIFGKSEHCNPRLLMDLHLLIFYLYLIYKERQRDRDAGSTYETSYYVEKYCLITIRNKFTCRGIDINQLAYIFNLFDLYFTPDGTDGIGNMVVEGTTPPINRINS